MLLQEFAELKRLNADALPFDLHRNEFQTTATSPGLSTDDDEFDDDDDEEEEDHIDSVDGQDSAAVTSTLHSDVIPDVIPNPHTTVDDEGSDVSENRPLSNYPDHNGRSDNIGKSSPHDVEKSRLFVTFEELKSHCLRL